MLPLIELIHSTNEKLEYPLPAATLSITGLTADSRQVEPGYLFFALRGEHSNGEDFIPQAEQKGGVAVLTDKDFPLPRNKCGASSNPPPQAGEGTKTSPLSEGVTGREGAFYIRSDNPQLAMAKMAARFYNHQPQHIAAVTGTDGKTSTADFFRQFWHGLGKSSASVGTLGVVSGQGEILYPGSHTTPYPIQLHAMLGELAGKPTDYVCMEASSHGLHQYRLDGVNLKAAAFTNLARDHLDYHKTEQDYFAAKLRLFDALLPEGQTAVVNQDDGRFAHIEAVCKRRKHRLIGFGKRGKEFKINAISALPCGQRVEAELLGKLYVIEVPLVGAFQVMNILAALGLVIGTGGNMEEALAVVPKFHGVSGRLEQVLHLKNGATVFIDYAHTPMALANILNTLRAHTLKKLHVVFGCGGDRDAGKRPEMGKIAELLADDAIITDDNPRSENSALIRASIMAATMRAKEIADRREAIYVALKCLAPGDVLVIAGKGHEKIQIIGDKTFPFDDAEVVRQAAKELKLAA